MSIRSERGFWGSSAMGIVGGMLAAIMPVMMSDSADPPGGGGGGGGDPPAPPADPNIFGDPPAAPPADPNTPPADPALAAKWVEAFSAEAIDADNPSHRDWLTAKGFKSIDDVVKSYRETERAFRAGDKVVIPKEGASVDDVKAFHKALGVPETAEGYQFTMPDGVTGELDAGLIGGFAEQALKLGIPKGAAEQLVRDWYIPLQMDMDGKAVATRNAERTALLGEWGADKDRNVALCNRAAAKLGLDASAVADIQQGFGARRTFELMLKLGQGIAEDAMLDGGGRERFGITPADAKSQKEQLMADKDFTAKLNAKDPDATAKLARLNAVIAAEMDANQGKRSAA